MIKYPDEKVDLLSSISSLSHLPKIAPVMGGAFRSWIFFFSAYNAVLGFSWLPLIDALIWLQEEEEAN